MSESVEENERAFDRGLENWINRLRALQGIISGIGEFSARTLIKATVAYAFFNPVEAYGYYKLLQKTGYKGARMGARIAAQEVAQKITWGKIIAEESARGTRYQNTVYRATGRGAPGMTLTQRLAAREARRRAVSSLVGGIGVGTAAELFLAMESEVNESINEGRGLTSGVAEYGVAPPSFIGGGTTF